jgi:hypothetical protein
LQAADCPGELPELVWIFQAPGREEKVIEGLRRIVGDHCPIAVDAGKVDGVPHFLLIHPESVGANGELNTFAAIGEGTRIFSMRGDKERLIDRAGRVAIEAVNSLPGGADNLAGGLMVYCAGCMLAVDQRMPEVAAKVEEAFGGHPFLGCFTFGEQGCVVEQNVHGNLMISAIAFGR